MNTSDEEYTKRRDAHAGRVIRNKDVFMGWYDAAAKMVFSGMSKADTIDTLAPVGCDHAQSNGVVAGANQAAALS